MCFHVAGPVHAAQFDASASAIEDPATGSREGEGGHGLSRASEGEKAQNKGLEEGHGRSDVEDRVLRIDHIYKQSRNLASVSSRTGGGEKEESGRQPKHLNIPSI